MRAEFNDRFEANGENWQYVPRDLSGIALFDGEPIASKSVIDLIGEAGVRKIDAILKGMKRAKEIIYGADSRKVGFESLQYFSAVNENQKLDDLPCIFKNNRLIVCNSEIVSDLLLSARPWLIKEHFDITHTKILNDKIVPFRDYVIHIIDDVYPVKDFRPEWDRIKEGDEKILTEIKGTEFLSDLF